MFTMTYPFKMRATLRAGHRLGVEATIERVAVLFITGWTQRKRRHHGKRAIVRHRANNGETRAAVGTVDKRITITPFAWGIHFGKASRASGGIGNNLRIHGAARALADGELSGQLWPDKRLTLDAINTRQRRAVLMQLNKKRFRVFQQPDFYAIAVITDIAVKI